MTTEAYIDDKKLVIINKPTTIRFELSKNVDQNLKHEIDSIIKHNELLAELKIKNMISPLLPKHKHGKDIHGYGRK